MAVFMETLRTYGGGWEKKFEPYSIDKYIQDWGHILTRLKKTQEIFDQPLIFHI